MPSARGALRWSAPGDADVFEPGVYRRDESESLGWLRVARLPVVHARVVRRDGAGRVAGTDYLMSATPEGERALYGHLSVRSGEWANIMSVALSDDDQVIRAAGSAIRLMAEDAPERDATPRLGSDGRMTVPVRESLPAGYLETAPVERGQALETWREVVQIAVRSRWMALVLGASAVAPFVRPLKRKSHTVSLWGDATRGKTTVLRAAAAIWGSPEDDGGIVQQWDASAIGLTRYLGGLGLLPGFLDEAGTADLTPERWGKLLYSVAHGAQRITGDRTGDRARVSRRWYGILFSSGNGRLLDGLESGKYAGLPRRVIELDTPFTLRATDAERVETDLLPSLYGHLGEAILDRPAADVAALIRAAEDAVPLPDGGTRRAIARHLHAYVAGAMLIDDLAGTGTILSDQAAQEARVYLDHVPDHPEHDADRLLAALAESLAAVPAAWPTHSAYRESARPREDTALASMRDPDRTALPQHGIARELHGVRDDEGQWLAVFPAWVADVAESLGIDRTVALRELHARGLLHVTAATRKAGEYKHRQRLAGIPVPVYRLRLPDLPELEDLPYDDPDEHQADEHGQEHGQEHVPEREQEQGAAQQVPAPSPTALPLPEPDRASAGPAAPVATVRQEQRQEQRQEHRPVYAVGCAPEGLWLGDERLVPAGDAYASLPALLARLREVMPDGGTVAVDADVAALVGYPDGPMSAMSQRAAKAAAGCRAVTEAAAQDWRGSQIIDAWTTWWGDARPRYTLVVPAWLATTDMDASGHQLLDPGDDAAAAAYLLAAWRERVGAPYLMTAGTAALARIHAEYERGRSRPGRRWTPSLRWDASRSPGETACEARLGWARTLTPTEQAAPSVIGVDGTKAYVGSQLSAAVSIRPLVPSDPEDWDRYTAGYVQVARHGWELRGDDVRWELLPPWLTDQPGTGAVWVTTPTAVLWMQHGMPREAIVDAWLPAPHSSEGQRRHHTKEALRPVAEVWRDVILGDGSDTTDPHDRRVIEAAKAAYSETAGMLRRGTPYVRRPDWSDTIIATWRTTLMRKVLRLGEAADMWPVKIDTDCAWYAIDTPVPDGWTLGEAIPTGAIPVPLAEIYKIPVGTDRSPQLGEFGVKYWRPTESYIAGEDH
ncbi:DUF927 domain-containing protein [Actinomadura atramentaria]|uniref:DUF927 domain-containing protein n=1 Tax=Actinomadura atramentaria TaxID=1990 RepID=UPI00146EA704|nr:DUF927 domain-containing protein [Actinomadura atramentaria]